MKRINTVKRELLALQHGQRNNPKSRLLDGFDIDRFYELVSIARKFCKKYNLNLDDFEIEVNGGGIPHSYKYPAETTICRLTKGNPQVFRGKAKSAPYGNVKQEICRIEIKKENPAREKMQKDGLIKGGKWINLI